MGGDAVVYIFGARPLSCESHVADDRERVAPAGSLLQRSSTRRILVLAHGNITHF